MRRCSLISQQFEALLRRVRAILEAGSSIAIVGWIDSNHSPFTRQIGEGKVVFREANPISLPERVGLVLLTRFVDHTVSHRIRKTKEVYRLTLGTGQIKEILESCRDLLTIVPAPRIVREVVREMVEAVPNSQEAASPAIMPGLPSPALPDLSTPAVEIKKETQMTAVDWRAFTQAFLEAAHTNRNKPGLVGKKTFGRLCREHNIGDSPSQLASVGWIVPQAGYGNTGHVGWYGPGEKMGVSRSIEPEDLIERARHLVAQHASTLAEKGELERRLEEVRQKLEMIGKAQELLGQLAALMKPKE